jgi:hypothetical protein
MTIELSCQCGSFAPDLCCRCKESSAITVCARQKIPTHEIENMMCNDFSFSIFFCILPNKGSNMAVDLWDSL